MLTTKGCLGECLGVFHRDPVEMFREDCEENAVVYALPSLAVGGRLI